MPERLVVTYAADVQLQCDNFETLTKLADILLRHQFDISATFNKFISAHGRLESGKIPSLIDQIYEVGHAHSSSCVLTVKL